MTIPNYITRTDVSGRVTSDVYNRWFAKTTSGTPDTTFLDLCIDDACSQWQLWMGDALPGDWSDGGTVENLVKRRLVGLVLYFAAEAQPRGAAEPVANPFQTQFESAEKLADQLRKGREAKLITSAVTTPSPQGDIVTVGRFGNTDDSQASPYVRQANGSLVTGF